MCYADAHKKPAYSVRANGNYFDLFYGEYPLYRGLTEEGCQTLIAAYLKRGE